MSELPFEEIEIEIDEDRLDAFTTETGCFVEAPGAEPDTFTLDLTNQLHRDTLTKFIHLSFDIELSMALTKRIEELNEMGIDTGVLF